MAVRPINAINLKKYIKGLDVSLPHDKQDKDDVIRQVCCIIDNWPTLTPPNEWVSVEERLPDELTMVLIYSGGIYDVAGWIEDEDGKICWTHNAKPQFWRPIPGLEPPGKDNNVPTKEQNEPLTLEQLREMDGEPVWVVPTGTHEKDEPMWCVLEGPMALIPGVDCWSWGFDGYGETWMAYRRPPEGET